MQQAAEPWSAQRGGVAHGKIRPHPTQHGRRAYHQQHLHHGGWTPMSLGQCPCDREVAPRMQARCGYGREMWCG